ncbi:MAG: hypothetical protein KDE20_22500, partial [Caldilineaceae bacterium]|nr:hypothetical protein [Caldilineaceae bacterium]
GMGTGVQPSLWSRLHEAAMPTLLLTGAEDAKFCAIAQAMVNEMPRAQHTIIANAGHTVHLEQPDDFTRVVEQFLQRQKARHR